MSRMPKHPPTDAPERRRRETEPVVRPSGRFVSDRRIRITTDRSPWSVTSINPDEMRPILPEMPYIPPA